MDLCDDIAYSTHDIEDGIRAGKIQMNATFFEDQRLIRHLVMEILNDPNQHKFGWEQVDIEQMVRQVSVGLSGAMGANFRRVQSGGIADAQRDESPLGELFRESPGYSG